MTSPFLTRSTHVLFWFLAYLKQQAFFPFSARYFWLLLLIGVSQASVILSRRLRCLFARLGGRGNRNSSASLSVIRPNPRIVTRWSVQDITLPTSARPFPKNCAEYCLQFVLIEPYCSNQQSQPFNKNIVELLTYNLIIRLENTSDQLDPFH